MNGLRRFSKIAFVLIFSLFSVQNLFINNLVSVAHAADCSGPGPAAKLGIYSTNRPDFLKPTPTLDPQSITVGQQSTRMEVEIEDASGCPTTTNPLTTRVTVSISDHVGDLLTIGGVNQGESYNFTIAKTSSRGGFFVKGKALATATLTAITRVDSDIQLISGTQTMAVAAPVPDATKLVFTNNPHGVSDTIQGLLAAVPAGASVTGIVVRAYADLAGVTQLGTDAFVAADGSFVAIATGDDQYRTVYVRAVYPALIPVLSDPVAVTQNYPALVSGLTAVHGANDRPQLSWIATEPGATFRIYRKLSADPSFVEPAAFVSSLPTFTDTTAVLGTTYVYAVKQVSVGGSYTPEFLPTATIRLDLSAVVFMPEGSSTTQTTPSVSFTVTAALRNVWNVTPSVIRVAYTNTVSGAVYTATVQVANDSTNQMLGSAPYITAASVPVPNLPDGSYSAQLSAFDAVSGVNDAVSNAVTYAIDTVVPLAPVLSALRYSPNILSGIAGAVEPSVNVDVYVAADLSLASKVGSVPAAPDGSFILTPVTTPAAGIFYVVARDTAGNTSSATAFDAVSTPRPPMVSKLVMEQNFPGTADRIISAAGGVTGSMTVRMYVADPSTNPNLVALYELVANPDGSFTQNVGDNTAPGFWITVVSGNGTQSPAAMLTNATFIAAPTSFRAVAGDNSVTVKWDAVSAATYYTIEVYNITAQQNIQKAVLASTQTSLQLTLRNNASYRFYVHAVDAYGNVSAPLEVESTPHAPQIVLASSPTTSAPETPPVVTKHVAPPVPPVHAEEAAPTATAVPAPESQTRDWTTWLTVGLGLVLLALATFFGWQLWSNQPTETVVTTTKKSSTKKPTNQNSRTGSDTQKPRW